jgi:oligopeptide transport system ATP-binding protein
MTELLNAAELVKEFPLRQRLLGPRNAGVVKAVDGVSFRINQGETLALVGESGCGKSTLARLVLRLIDVTSGKISFQGEDITEISGSRLRDLRRKMQIVFQDPYASLNPRMNARSIIEEPLLVHKISHRKTWRHTSDELLELVGLDPSYGERLPNEFSGGQRQRIGIARALALRPSLVVCDEPVSALDVSVQAQVLNLFKDLQQRFQLSYLFISHDLAVVKYIADRVAVMYLGSIVETAPTERIFSGSMHPYTRALLASVPGSDFEVTRKARVTEGDVPSPLSIPTGCRFHTRCPFAIDICKAVVPPFVKIGADHFSACHRWDELPELPSGAKFSLADTPMEKRLKIYNKQRDTLADGQKNHAAQYQE